MGAMGQKAERLVMGISSVVHKYGIHPNQLFRWRRLIQDGALCMVKAGEGVVPLSKAKELQRRIREMEWRQGQKCSE